MMLGHDARKVLNELRHADLIGRSTGAKGGTGLACRRPMPKPKPKSKPAGRHDSEHDQLFRTLLAPVEALPRWLPPM